MTSQQRNPKSLKLEGLREISHNVLQCSNCKKPLVDVVVTQEAEFLTKFRAECPFCPVDQKGRRERSFPVCLKGFVIIGRTDAVLYTGQDELEDDLDVDASILILTEVSP